MKTKNYINILFIIVWMLVIFNFSNQQGTSSSGLSDRIIIKIAQIITQNKLTEAEKEQIINKYSFIIRKTAHFISYFILGTLTIILTTDLYSYNKKTFLFTLLFNFLYASTDEIHQLFINGRNGSFLDVLLDTTGALTAISLVFLLNYINRRIKTK